MKSLFVFTFSIGLLFSFSNTIHDFSVPKLQGGTQAMSAYTGKKIMIVTLPVQQNASADSFLYSLDTLAAAHSSNLAVIAVPAFEEGYHDSLQVGLQEWYSSKLGNDILVTGGLYVRKISGSQQHELFQWLTKSTGNGVFDVDADGPGYKFFANGVGGIYAVLRPESPISGKSVQKMLRL